MSNQIHSQELEIPHQLEKQKRANFLFVIGNYNVSLFAIENFRSLICHHIEI
jgi:hypothetical protein